MLEDAYDDLHALEGYHWWYVGARFVYQALLEVGLGKPRGTKRMLDIGCGSGGNLSLLGNYGPTLGIEISARALKMTSTKPALGLVQADATALPFSDQIFDGVSLLGVIEHIKDDSLALQEAKRVCQSDGVVVLLTSALPILWSHHDEANLHERRYRIGQFRELIIRSNLSPLRISYQNFFVFLPTLIVRMGQRLFPNQPNYDMGNPPRLVNQLLIWISRLEAWLIVHLPLPVGVDLVAVCRPRINSD